MLHLKKIVKSFIAKNITSRFKSNIGFKTALKVGSMWRTIQTDKF